MRFALLAIVACAMASAVAQEFPSRPIRIIVPFPPGGVTDPLGRLLGEELRKSFGQPAIVENKPGAGTVIGVEATAKSKPDGHTIGIVGNSFTINHTLVARLPYDTLKDLRPVGLMVRAPNVMVGHPSVPARDLRGLVAYAKANPGKLTYASSGTGTAQHLIGESIKLATGMDLVHVPYKGAGPAVSDLLGAQVNLLVGNVPVLLPHIAAGKVRAFGVSTTDRAQAAPQVPSFAEQGYPMDLSAWFGIVAPAGVPDAIVARLNAEVVRTFSSPEVVKMLAAQGYEPIPGSPEAFAAHIRSEIAHYSALIKQGSVKLD